MKRKPVLVGFIVFVCFLFLNIFGKNGSPILKGKYLGQEPPGLAPVMFAKGIVSTEANELNCVFSPDGQELFFTVWKAGQNTLMTMRQENGRWTERTVVSFSGKYSDVDPYITFDGKKLFFSSMRPLQGGGPAKDSDLWYVEKDKSGQWL